MTHRKNLLHSSREKTKDFLSSITICKDNRDIELHKIMEEKIKVFNCVSLGMKLFTFDHVLDLFLCISVK